MNHLLHDLAAPDSGMTPAVDPARIAIFQALNLGDLLCTTPALRAVRRRYPRAEITVIGRAESRELIERLPTVDRFHPFSGFPGIDESPDISERSIVLPPPCDLAIQMHGPGDPSNGYVASLGAPWSVGYGQLGDKRLTAVLNWVENEPEPLRWLRLVAAVGATADQLYLEMPTTTQERRTASALIGPAEGRPLVGLHVGASDPARRWPSASFAALADMLVSRLNARIVLTGAAADSELTSSVRRAMQASSADLTGQTTLGEFAAVIAALDLLVTNDTAASHIAAATRTRSVVLFGPTRPERWAPLDLSLHHIIDAMANAPAGMDGAAALQELSPAFVAGRCQKALREARIVGRPRLVMEGIA
jgi:ADP-heptose:LPS heptosyltransferase